MRQLSAARPAIWRVAFACGVAAALVGTAAPAALEAQLDVRPPSIDQMATWAAPGGDIGSLQEAVLAHAEGAGGGTAVLWIQLFAVIEQVEPASAERAVRAVGLAVDGEGLEGAELLMNGVTGAPEAERPALMALAAHLADVEEEVRGAEIRSQLVAAHPDAGEAPEARLRRARYLLGEGDSRPEGLALLEELIIGDPAHPLAPEARRLFQANGGRAASAPAAGASL